MLVCYKARNVQLWGGKVGVIIDNSYYDNPERIIMIDDGTGKDIKIPTILVGQSDGTIFLEFLKSEKGVSHLGIEFSIAAPDNRVEYEIYYSLGYQLIRDMKDKHSSLGKNVLFTLHANIKKRAICL